MTHQHRPTWVTLVGILTLIFGLFSLLGAAQEIAVPRFLDMQQEVVMHVEEMAQESAADGSAEIDITVDGEQTTVDVDEIMVFVVHLFDVPEWFEDWAFSIGIMSLAIALLYCIAGIILLMANEISLPIFYTALTLSMLWEIFRIAIFAQTEAPLLLMQIPISVLSLLLDTILLVIVLAANKTSFARI
ncbi:hypothetical protein [Umboniibacter marinipuniceus]|uniref:Uncharacterized protein n=1 Tax=Umboniibacter marinipuniceus TaxID=569599 RepID=A0A3M0ACB9_9GAMM|nr:hypothetical protein [Umboniibacter marinipuniceus]RMA82570.1 hypothetical protein DFR27_0521 [Umboniibacter marinipuniceus]